MKKRSTAQLALMRKTRGTPTPPKKRTPAAADRALSPEEKLQEHLESKRLKKAWDEGRLTASLKG